MYPLVHLQIPGTSPLLQPAVKVPAGVSWSQGRRLRQGNRGLWWAERPGEETAGPSCLFPFMANWTLRLTDMTTCFGTYKVKVEVEVAELPSYARNRCKAPYIKMMPTDIWIPHLLSFVIFSKNFQGLLMSFRKTICCHHSRSNHVEWIMLLQF